jgi:2,3-bisphosphoglycerate-dependent phosphoglycerate mutase
VSESALILLRHGESTANAAGLFTGVLDAPLSEHGIREAQAATALLNTANLAPDTVFTSTLRRSQHTADIVTAELNTPPARSFCDWRLNERNYGALTGLSKNDVLREFGEERFLTWRRSVDTAPPPMLDPLYNEISASPPFRELPSEALTRTESLQDVITRVSSFNEERVQPLLAEGRSVLVIAHGNSLRALCAVIDDLSDEAVRDLNIPTGQPLVYRFGADLRPENVGGHYIDAATARAAALALAHEGGT